MRSLLSILLLSALALAGCGKPASHLVGNTSSSGGHTVKPSSVETQPAEKQKECAEKTENKEKPGEECEKTPEKPAEK